MRRYGQAMLCSALRPAVCTPTATLARKVLADAGVTYDDVPEDLRRPVGESTSSRTGPTCGR